MADYPQGNTQGSNQHPDRRSQTQHPTLQLTSPKQRQGHYYEQQALNFLQAQGLRLIAANWHQPKVGELDLVMLDTSGAWPIVVFVEVRQRKQSGYGDAALSVTKAKQRRLVQTARYFLQQHPQYGEHECRFDVLAYNSAAPVRPDRRPAADSGQDTKASPAHNTHQVPPPPDWYPGAFMAAPW